MKLKSIGREKSEKIYGILHLTLAECPYVNLGNYLTFLGEKNTCSSLPASKTFKIGKFQAAVSVMSFN